MKIQSGLFDHMVLQRTLAGVCDVIIRGDCGQAGTVKIRVKRGPWKAAGQARAGAFKARLKGLKAGGPYQLGLGIFKGGQLLETTTVKDVLVGDVWILGGQSNMQGCGRREEAEPATPQVRGFYMDDHWRVAKDPLHNLWDSVDPVHADINGGARPAKELVFGTGPGVSFGKAMRALSGVPQGLIACAHGGTSMAQWDPGLKRLAGKSLYGAALRRFQKNGGRVRGIVWYQGCSDATPEFHALFLDRLQNLIRSFRRDLGDAKLPFAQVQIARVTEDGGAETWNRVQEGQRLVQGLMKGVATVPAIDLDLDDFIHISGKDQRRLGGRLAQAMWTLLGGKGAQKPPIRLGRITSHAETTRGNAELEVAFEDVMGELQADGRPTGFELGGAEVRSRIWRTVVKGQSVHLSLNVPFQQLDGKVLHYGYGRNPFCNIRDSAGRSLPVFGPIALKGDAYPRTGFVTAMRGSVLLPSAGDLSGLDYPQDKRPLGLKTFQSEDPTFCFRRAEILGAAPKDVLLYFACDFTCKESMKLALCLGYDGPVKLWLDGKEVYRDPQGTNPALPDDAKVTVNAADGKHEVMVALGSNSGTAWGISLNIARLDAKAKNAKARSKAVEMPKILG